MRYFELVSVQVALAEICSPSSQEGGKKHAASHLEGGWTVRFGSLLNCAGF